MKGVADHAMRLVVGVVLALLVACGGQPPGPVGDAPFPGREAYGAEPPAGALLVTVEELDALAASDDFVWDSIARQERLRAEAEARAEADRAEVERLAAEDPALRWLLDEPPADAPGLERLPSGEYLLTLLDGRGSPLQVRTLSQADRFRDFLITSAAYAEAANQLAVYTHSFEALPPELRSGLPTPASLADASADEVAAARAALEAQLAADAAALGARSERLYLAAHGAAARPGALLSLQSIADYRPPGYPAASADEVGTGAGSDRGPSCARSADGLFEQFWWPLKYYATSVKAQGNRGSCVAFALTSALETSVAVRHNDWVNLSEQFLFNRIKRSWQPAHYGDGANTIAMAQAFAESDYVLPFEDRWNYNPSWDRLDLGFYLNSCVGYDEHCSDTAHQSRYACTAAGALSFCGFFPPPNAGGGGYRLPDGHVLWQNGLFSAMLGGVPWLTTWLLLMQGHSIVVSLDVDTSVRDATAGYVAAVAGDTLGGHAVHLVGFIPQAFIEGSELPQWVKLGAALSGGGYFVVKNSWGECSGDGGYLYLPVAWANARFKSMIVLDRGTAPTFLETAPHLEIVRPSDGATVPYGGINEMRFEAVVSDLQDGEACCAVRWTSDQDGILGNGVEIDHIFASPGTRVVTATATNAKGHTTSASVTVVATNSPPTVSIAVPSSGQTLHQGVPTVFQASATDINEFGGIDCASFAWTSSRATDPTLTTCAPTAVFHDLGGRVLTVTATDAFGASGSATVVVDVVTAPATWAVITEPVDGGAYYPGTTLTLRASVSDTIPLGAPYEWRAYGDPASYAVIASGSVMSVRGAPRFVPPHTWATSLEHEGKTFDLRLAVADDVLSDPVRVTFVVIPK
jgi:hypothetical protein